MLPRLLHDDAEQDIAPGTIERLDIMAALDTLSPRQRACVVLRFYEDHSVSQIGDELGCSVGTVKRYLSEANAPSAGPTDRLMRSSDMEESPNAVATQLEEAARRSAPLQITTETLIRRVQRRRWAGAAGVSAAVLALAGTGFAARGLLQPGRDTPQLPPAAAVPTTPPDTSTDSMQMRAFPCDGRIDAPTLPSAAYGSVHLTIDNVSRAADGRPQASVSFRTAQPLGFPATPGPTNLQMLILKDGMIVAGQDRLSPSDQPRSTGTGSRNRALQVVHADSAHPYRQTVQPRTATVCDGQSWNQLWDNGNDYQIAVIVSTLELSPNPELSPAGPDGKIPDTLLLATAPLQTR